MSPDNLYTLPHQAPVTTEAFYFFNYSLSAKTPSNTWDHPPTPPYAANQLGGDLLGGAGEEGLGEVPGGRGGHENDLRYYERSCKNQLEFLAAKLNASIRINKISSLAAERANSILNLAAERANSIGSRGAAEAFAHYIGNQAQFADDTELNNFMLFYSKNFSASSSQWSQDVFVLYACNSKKNGLFLEIGGADGFTHSNTYSLEKQYGWRGTLIEPDPYQFELLSISRPENTLINAAISPNDQEEKLRLRLVGQLSALEGYEGKDVHQATRLKHKSFAKVNAISITRVLSEKKYDYFSLDVEGAELSILKSIKWDAIIKPSILTIEHNDRKEDKRDILNILKTHGYAERLASHHWLRRGDIWATLNE